MMDVVIGEGGGKGYRGEKWVSWEGVGGGGAYG